MNRKAQGRVLPLLLLTLAVLAGLAARPLAAQAQGEWTPLGPPGGAVPALVLHPDDPRVLWAGTEGGGVFKSIDGGSSWAPINQGLANLSVTALAVAASDPDTLYAAAGVLPTVAGVYRSTDGGRSWARASRGLPPPPPFCGCGSLAPIAELAVHPRNPNRVFAATSRGLYRTSDGGRRWVPLGLLGAVLSVAIDPVRPSVVFASAEDGIWKSTDGGASWDQVTTAQGVGVLLIDPENHRTLWGGSNSGLVRSTDGGATWRTFTPGFRVLSLAVGPLGLPEREDIRVLWAGSPQGVLSSLDGGTSWIRAGLRQWPVPSLVAHPDRPGIVWAGTAGRGVFKTVDSGLSWRVSSRGLFALHTGALAFDPVTPDVVWVGTAGQGVFRSDDRGATWTARNAGIAPLTITDLEVDPRDPETVWAASAGRGIFVTEDGGQTWGSRSQGLVPPGAQFPLPVNVLKLAPSSPDMAYAGTRDGLFRTSDAGGQWTRLDTPFLPRVTDILIDQRDPDVVFVATGELWVTRDGAATWERVAVAAEPTAPTGIIALAADPQDPDSIYAAGEEGVFRSADGGHTWQRVATSPVSRIVSLSVGALGEVWAAGPGGAFRSPDGISGWMPVPGLERKVPDEIAVDPHDPDNVYAATYAGVFRH